MRRCVIVGGARIGRYGAIRPLLRPDDYMIYCDGGLDHEAALSRAPDLIVGDFDSHEKPASSAEVIVLPREKDDTDTFFAAKEAVRRGFSEFLLIGAVGGRFDHSLGNLSLLLYLDSLGKRAVAADDFSEMEIVSRAPSFVAPEFPYFSLLAVAGDARGVTVKDALYPLRDAVITPDFAYGVSNEPLPGKSAEISVGEGRLLLVRVRGE